MDLFLTLNKLVDFFRVLLILPFVVKLYCHSVLLYLNLLNFQEINCLFSQFLLPTFQMFEEIKNGSTRFSIGEDQICETCHNARMIKVFFHY